MFYRQDSTQINPVIMEKTLRTSKRNPFFIGLGYHLLIALAIWITTSSTAYSATIFLKDGREIKTEKCWSASGFVEFHYNGMIARIPEKEVDRIEDKKPAPGALPAKTASPDKALFPPTPENTKTALEKAPGDKKLTVSPPPYQKKKSGADTEYLTTIIAAISKYKKEVGFRGLCWASTVYYIYGLEKVGEEPIYGGIDKYVNVRDKLEFGAAKIEKIVYGFWKGEFLSVTLWVGNEDHYKALREETFKRFGDGGKSASGEERYIWIGGASDKYLEFDSATGKG